MITGLGRAPFPRFPDLYPKSGVFLSCRGSGYPTCSGRRLWGSAEWIPFDSGRWIAYNENI